MPRPPNKARVFGEHDLQAAVDNVYDLVGYRFAIDYKKPPPGPAVTTEELAWIDQRLRQEKLRP